MAVLARVITSMARQRERSPLFKISPVRDNVYKNKKYYGRKFQIQKCLVAKQCSPFEAERTKNAYLPVFHFRCHRRIFL